MKRDLVLWVFLVALVTLTAGKPRRRRDHFGTADSTKPWKIQRVGNEFRRAVPSGYSVRSGDCPGNDIWALYRSRTTLKECARLCSSSTKCQAFMLYNNRTCYPKTKSCPTTTKSNPLNVFYDKVPSGYTMRPGDCSGNDIWGIHGFVSLSECANRCNSDSRCVSFMYYDNKECFPKTKTCAKPSTANPKNVFYDKIKHTIPRGYDMRPGDCPGNDIQRVGNEFRRAVPSGYSVRSGDCPGNDIWALYRSRTTLKECARLCSSSTKCQAFMLYNNRTCYPKTKSCPTTTKSNPLNVFYDKVPSGYTMRPGDCSGNDIWGIHGFVSLSECANRCNSDSRCVSFMYYDNKECFPKTKTCAKPSTANPKNVFYDKIEHIIPKGYAMRPGDCPGNDIWSIHGFVSLEECARRCNGNPACVSFMFYDGRECYPKTKTCPTTDKTNAKNFFYDKIKII